MTHPGITRPTRFSDRTSARSFRLGAAFLLAGLMLPIAGCVDEEASLRSDLQVKITDATEDLTEASVIVAAPFEPDSVSQARSKLSGVASSMSSVNGGDPGQQAAAQLLVASANQQLARLDLVKIDELESAAAPILFAATSELRVALRLNAFADGCASDDSTAQRQHLRGFMADMESVRSRLSSELASLDGPIDERHSQNESDAAQATQLSDEANRLYGRAESMGHADGLESFKQAVRLERESDSYQLKIAHRENELDYDYTPRHAIAQARVSALNNVLNEVGTVLDDLESHDRLNDDQVAHTREAVRTFGQRINAALGTLAESDATLDKLYGEAIGRLQQAATAAQRAASKDRSAAATAHITRARAFEQMAQIHGRRSRMLAARTGLLQGVVDASDALGTSSGARARLTALQSAFDAANAATRAAYSEAKGALEQSGNDPAIARFLMSINKILDDLGGPVTEG